MGALIASSELWVSTGNVLPKGSGAMEQWGGLQVGLLSKWQAQRQGL